MSNIEVQHLLSRVRRRRKSRGAVMVESVVVISVFILFLLGLIYFRELYVRKLTTMRLARAAALAQAMGACRHTTQGVLGPDLPKDSAPTERASRDQTPFDMPKGGDAKTNNLLSGMADKGTGTYLNEIRQVSLSGKASATTRDGLFKPEYGFRGNVSSSSFVSCGDEITDKQYTGIGPFAASIFWN